MCNGYVQSAFLLIIEKSSYLEGFFSALMRLKLYLSILILFSVITLTAKGENFVSDSVCYKILPTEKHVKIVGCNKKDVTILIPDSVYYKGKTFIISEIDYWAFDNCTNAKHVHFPATCLNIFRYCPVLEKITVDSENPAYKDIDGVMFSRMGHDLICYPRNKTNKTYIIPQGTKKICDSAFFECKHLEKVDMPQSMCSIGNSAFTGCSQLKSINIPPLVRRIPNYAFYNCMKLDTIFVSNPFMEFIGEYAFSYSSWKEANILIPNHTIEAFRKNKYWSRFSHFIMINP